MASVDRKDYLWALKQFRAVRQRGNRRTTDPWAFRQALLTVLELDTTAALDTGITREQLIGFDVEAAIEIQKFLEAEPK